MQDVKAEIAKKLAMMGLGLAVITKEKAEEIAKELEEKGQMTSEESRAFVEELIKKSEKQKAEIEKRISEEVKKATAKLNFATKTDIIRLEKRIAALEKKKKTK